MQLCQTHWGRLKDAIDERGLRNLVSHDAEHAIAALAGDGFDPLAEAVMAIYANAISLAGIDAMGFGCPICDLNRVHAETCEGAPCVLPKEGAFEEWIAKAADGAAEHAAQRKAGLN